VIFKIFLPKISAKKLAFSTQNKAKLFKILILTLVFEKNANFFAENFRKSQKIVIITSTPWSHWLAGNGAERQSAEKSSRARADFFFSPSKKKISPFGELSEITR
jgi:predicted dinucleotide-binding enzyme